MALYIQDVTGHEELKGTYQQSRTVLLYIQIDNYDEVMQGQTEAERTSLLLAVNQSLNKWLKNLGGFMRRVSDDLYVVILTREALDQAINERFDVLDKVRQLQSTNRLPVTLSMGVAVAENQTMAELGAQAQAGLDLALGRGGDQVAVQIGGKMQFFGGRAKAVEKLEQAYRAVMAMEGTLGADISDNMRALNSWMMTYQNFRLLSTTLFSSFADVVGLVVNGGELGDAWDAFVTGIKEVKLGWGDRGDGADDLAPGDGAA